MNRLRRSTSLSSQASSAVGPSIPVHLLLLAAPVIATVISRTVMSFIDFVMVSRLGTEAQAAVTPAGLLLFCAIVFGMGVVSAVSTFVSQSMGRNQLGECSAYTWQGVHLSMVMGIVLLPTWWLIEPLFQWAGHSPNVIRLEVIYTKIGLWGIGPTIAAVALSNFMTGIHRPAIGFVAVLLSNLFNVVGNYALIFGKWGFPMMGMAGAAWATLAASILQCLILLGWMLLPYYRRRFHTHATCCPSLVRMVRLLRVGLPSGVQSSGDVIAWTIFTIFLIGQFGPVHMAANNICFKLLELSFMPAVGMAAALTVAVGKLIGQKQYDRAHRHVRWAMIYNVGYMGVMGVMFAIFNRGLPALMTQDASVIHWASRIMLFCAAFQLFDALHITYTGALRGAGDTLWGALVMVASAIVVILGGGIAIAHFLPQWASGGLWLVATIHIAVVGVAYGLRYALGPWRRLNVFI